jgi:hypothetical protein
MEGKGDVFLWMLEERIWIESEFFIFVYLKYKRSDTGTK